MSVITTCHDQSQFSRKGRRRTKKKVCQSGLGKHDLGKFVSTNTSADALFNFQNLGTDLRTRGVHILTFSMSQTDMYIERSQQSSGLFHIKALTEEGYHLLYTVSGSLKRILNRNWLAVAKKWSRLVDFSAPVCPWGAPKQGDLSGFLRYVLQ